MKASGLSFTITMNPSFRRNFETKYKSAKSPLRKAEKQRSVTRIRCPDSSSAPIAETRLSFARRSAAKEPDYTTSIADIIYGTARHIVFRIISRRAH